MKKKNFGLFDAVYVINCESDSGRLRRITSRLNAFDVSFERFPAIFAGKRREEPEHSLLTAAEYACHMSHVAVLNRIVDRKQEYALILEDDAVFRDDACEYMRCIVPFLKGSQWDIFYMGLHLIESMGRLSTHLGRAKRAFHAHAYAVTSRSAERLLRLNEEVLVRGTTTFDEFPDEQLVKLYSIPLLAVQEPSVSHTTGLYLDRLPQYFLRFDGDDFESHCSEMKTWKSKWRHIVGFVRDLRTVQRHYEAGSLAVAVRALDQAVASWPEATEHLFKEPPLRDAMRGLIVQHATDDDMIASCNTVVQAIGRAFRHYYYY